MPKKLDPRRQKLKDEFTRNRGYWAPLWDDVLELSPDYFEAYSNLSSVPWKTGTLAPKVKEFVYIAIDAATAHLYNPGTRIHIANALRQRAAPRREQGRDHGSADDRIGAGHPHHDG